MKLRLFYILHFGVIVISSFFSVTISFLDFHEFEKTKITEAKDVLEPVLHNPVYTTYSIFSGTNTGYGFYGINVATYKYFSVEVCDQNNELLTSVSDFGFKYQNNYGRFGVLASKLFNFIIENENFPKSQNEERLLEIRKLYVNKIFKHVGLYAARKVKGATSYKVTLYAVSPESIWENKDYNNSKKVGIVKSVTFKL